ncbi:MAG: chromate transporter [Erysipelotrichaceae bacterium]|nr:chromate transporter [Erysipelotrichaceae bacterium]
MEVAELVLIRLFGSLFYISAFTFGGGYVIVPLMQKRFVEELQWIDENEMLDMIAIAQSAPGPVAVNASILVGYKVANIIGSLVAVVATVLPPLIIISVVSMFYEQFKTNVLVNLFLQGMKAAVCAVIFDVVIRLARNIIGQRDMMNISLIMACFIAATLLNLNVAIIILACATVGVLRFLFKGKRGKN